MGCSEVLAPSSLLRSVAVSSHVGKGLPCHLHLDKPLSTEQSLGVIVRSPSPAALGTPVISVSSVSLWSSYGLASMAASGS